MARVRLLLLYRGPTGQQDVVHPRETAEGVQRFVWALLPIARRLGVNSRVALFRYENKQR